METHLPNRGNTEVGQRGSGHLAVSTSVWVAGLIKPAQSPDAGLETRLGANQDRKRRTRTSVLTSANLGRPTADSQGFKPDLGNPAVRDYRGASGNVAMVEMRSHLAIERARLVTLHLQQARRSSIPTVLPLAKGATYQSLFWFSSRPAACPANRRCFPSGAQSG